MSALIWNRLASEMVIAEMAWNLKRCHLLSGKKWSFWSFKIEELSIFESETYGLDQYIFSYKQQISYITFCWTQYCLKPFSRQIFEIAQDRLALIACRLIDVEIFFHDPFFFWKQILIVR